eukprot:354835-Rhodomonas_salina.2
MSPFRGQGRERKQNGTQSLQTPTGCGIAFQRRNADGFRGTRAGSKAAGPTATSSSCSTSSFQSASTRCPTSRPQTHAAFPPHIDAAKTNRKKTQEQQQCKTTWKWIAATLEAVASVMGTGDAGGEGAAVVGAGRGGAAEDRADDPQAQHLCP